jgi:hypothetical protein
MAEGAVMEDSTATAEVEQSTAEIGVDDLEKVGHQEPEAGTDTETETDQVEESTEEVEGEGGEEEVVEYDEFDIGGKKLSVAKGSIPDEVKGEFQNYAKAVQATYTKKSQEVSEMAKALEARETAVKQLQTMQEQYGDIYSKGLQVQNEVAQYQAALTPELMQNDPDTYRLYSDTLANKRAELGAVDAELRQHEQGLADTRGKENARLMEEGKAKLERRIKGFSSKADEIVEYVSSTYGMDKEQAKQTWPLNPAAAEMAYKAMLFDKLQTKVKTTSKAKSVAPKPIKSISGKGGSVTKNPEKMSMDEYVKWRAKGNG